MSGEVVAALAGVLVGSLTSFLVEWRRECREARAGARTIAVELRAIREALELATKENGIWLGGPLPTDAWRAHQATLAASLSGDEWTLVALPYEQLERLKSLIESYFKAHDEVTRDMDVVTEHGEIFKLTHEAVIGAESVLVRREGGPGLLGRLARGVRGEQEGQPGLGHRPGQNVDAGKAD